MNTAKYSAAQAIALMDLHKAVPACVNQAGQSDFQRYEVAPHLQIERGILFIDKNCNAAAVDNEMFNAAVDLYGIDAIRMNATFYKGKDYVINKSRWELFIDQVIHYAGTYGRAAVGLKPLTLIPLCELEIPEADFGQLKITVIRLIGDDEVENLVNETILTTKAPSSRIRENIKALLPLFTGLVDDIRSFEIAVMACEHLGLVPKAPNMFLRYLVYVTTGTPMVINNQRTVRIIKAQANLMGNTVHDLLVKADMVRLSGIFLRNKNLFLAFKAHSGCAPIINKLRRMANTYHKPLSGESVQNYIALALAGKTEKLAELHKVMDNREMVKVLNAMAVRMAVEDYAPGVFNVRNGRSYCKDNAYAPLTIEQFRVLDDAQETLFKVLIDRLRPTVEGKVFYMPSYVDYAVPVSEKQYVGNYPWGTFFSADEPKTNTTVGVSWVNPTEDDGTDLDLHCFTADGHHFGWNSDFYSNGGTCVYSGDMTNAPAPDGAAEAFWINGVEVPIIFTLNKFNGPDKVDFKLALSSEEIKQATQKYTMDPNKLLFAPIPLKFENGHGGMTLGYIKEGVFTLYSGNLSNGAVPRGNFARYIQGIITQNEHKGLLRDLLLWCDATVINSAEALSDYKERGEAVIDLSPEALTASTLLDIIDGKQV